MSLSWPEMSPLASLITSIFTVIIIAALIRFAAGSQHVSTMFSGTNVKVPATLPCKVPLLGHYIMFCYKEPHRWIEQIR